MSVMRHYATAATGAIASTLALDPVRKYQILEVRLHLDAAGGAAGDVNMTITVDAIKAAAHDTVLITQDMTLVTDFVYQPAYPQIFDAGDEIDIAYANAGNAEYGLTIIYNLL